MERDGTSRPLRQRVDGMEPRLHEPLRRFCNTLLAGRWIQIPAGQLLSSFEDSRTLTFLVIAVTGTDLINTEPRVRVSSSPSVRAARLQATSNIRTCLRVLERCGISAPRHPDFLTSPGALEDLLMGMAHAFFEKHTISPSTTDLAVAKVVQSPSVAVTHASTYARLLRDGDPEGVARKTVADGLLLCALVLDGRSDGSVEGRTWEDLLDLPRAERIAVVYRLVENEYNSVPLVPAESLAAPSVHEAFLCLASLIHILRTKRKETSALVEAARKSHTKAIALKAELKQTRQRVVELERQQTNDSAQSSPSRTALHSSRTEADLARHRELLDREVQEKLRVQNTNEELAAQMREMKGRLAALRQQNRALTEWKERCTSDPGIILQVVQGATVTQLVAGKDREITKLKETLAEMEEDATPLRKKVDNLSRQLGQREEVTKAQRADLEEAREENDRMRAANVSLRERLEALSSWQQQQSEDLIQLRDAVERCAASAVFRGPARSAQRSRRRLQIIHDRLLVLSSDTWDACNGRPIAKPASPLVVSESSSGEDVEDAVDEEKRKLEAEVMRLKDTIDSLHGEIADLDQQLSMASEVLASEKALADEERMLMERRVEERARHAERRALRMEEAFEANKSMGHGSLSESWALPVLEARRRRGDRERRAGTSVSISRLPLDDSLAYPQPPQRKSAPASVDRGLLFSSPQKHRRQRRDGTHTARANS